MKHCLVFSAISPPYKCTKEKERDNSIRFNHKIVTEKNKLPID